MAQPTVTTTAKKTVVKRPQSAEDAMGATRGMVAEGNSDENLIASYDLKEFVELGAIVPEKFKVGGKVAFREYTNGDGEVKHMVSFIINGKWEHVSPSRGLQEAGITTGEPLSVSKHAIQLRFNPEATGDEAPCYYLITKKGGASAPITLDDFAD